MSDTLFDLPSEAMAAVDSLDGKPVFECIVRGLPAPQGSKRAFVNRHTGRAAVVESSKAVGPWRDAVRAEAQRSRDAALSPLDGPLAVLMAFTLRKPASAPKRRRIWPDRIPDLSKLVRSTEDALTDAGVWVDDARVVQLVTAKSYPDEGPHALPSPGALIRVWVIA